MFSLKELRNKVQSLTCGDTLSPSRSKNSLQPAWHMATSAGVMVKAILSTGTSRLSDGRTMERVRKVDCFFAIDTWHTSATVAIISKNWLLISDLDNVAASEPASSCDGHSDRRSIKYDNEDGTNGTDRTLWTSTSSSGGAADLSFLCARAEPAATVPFVPVFFL